ncbi:MAG: hypothetical protein ACE1ZQ_11145 [Ignavibacteriaceae bacterium]
MPNIPEPYEIRNWEEVVEGYDSLVFDFNQTGQYLPLIWWRTNTVNYSHISFGLHTVVGTNSPFYFRLSDSQFIARVPAIEKPQPGIEVDIYFNLDKLHFFSLDDGKAIR